MKTTLKILAVATMILVTGKVSSQDNEVLEQTKPKWERKVRPIRFGAKLGNPNLIGGNVEYVSPLLNNKLAVSFDYSILKSDWLGLEEDSSNDDSGLLENSFMDFSYMEGGLNYYFFKPGQGLYGSFSYGVLKINGTITYENAKETIDFSHGSLNLKLGAKLGGLFYFRPEIGYSFSPLPETYDSKLTYEDGTSETETLESPVAFLPSGLIANIGLGFAF